MLILPKLFLHATPVALHSNALFDVLSLVCSGHQQQRRRHEAGQLAFGIIFTDESSGIFVRTIPKAGSLLLLGLPLAVVARRRRR
jgi:hypothetical protein